MCRALGVEVHHITPEAENGSNTEENAAPLCPSCHETYGVNPVKRKLIQQSRDLWYEICEKRYASDPDRLDKIGELLRDVATKDDLDLAVEKMTELLRSVAAREGTTLKARAMELSTFGPMLAPGIGMNRQCKKCGTFIGLYIGDQGKCPQCGTPW
jgi:predicted Zn-ribbon and HTH transcriptional regulator